MGRLLRQFGYRVEQADLGGWIPLVGGLILIAITVLVPAWRDLQAARDQQARMVASLGRHTEQLRQYHQLIVSVRDDDPMILQRLAWHELRLKPIGAEVFGEMPAQRRQRAVYEQWITPIDTSNNQTPRTTDDEIMLERIVSKRHRPVVQIIATALIGFGLFTSLRPREDEG